MSNMAKGMLGCGMACLLLAAQVAEGSLLVYEGYNGYSAGSMVGQNVNGSAVGIEGVYGGNDINYSATGLAFGSLQVAGGSVASNTNAQPRLFADIASSAAATGDLWGSYLFQASGTNGNLFTHVGPDTSTKYLRSGATFGSGSSGRSGVSYSSSNTGLATSGSSVVSTGTTYIMISKWTHVGEALSGSNVGTAQYWILTQAQFASFVTAGRTESYLTSASLGTGSSQVFAALTTPSSLTSGTFVFDDTQMVGLSVDFQYNSNNIFDEIRYGTTLLDVTPVPEPSSAVLLLFAAGMGWYWASKRTRKGLA